MMGAQFWQPQVSTHLKKCSEFVSPACDPVQTDGCCAVIPCSYCLSWAVYGSDTVYGTAAFATDGWYGTIAGAEFRGYWEVGYDSGECEFVVTLDGVEVYRNDCYGGQSCRDSSDSAETNIYPDDGTLTWTKVEPRSLEYVVDPDTNCRTHFCGGCECSCDCLCVEIIDSTGVPIRGEICDVSYPCDGPVWEGTVGYYVLSMALGRDIYGECILTATVDGVAQDPVYVTGCANMSATIDLYGVSRISVFCKTCGCDDNVVYPCECREDALAIFKGFVTTSSGSPCEIDPIAGGVVGDPVTNLAWNTGDCTLTTQWVLLITAFPPNCTEGDPDLLSARVVFVQKLTEADAPNIDNTQVEMYDWYAVVYLASTDTIVAVYYEYEICCINETPTNPATSHLAWIRFPNVTLVASTFTLLWYNVTTAAAYGNCGYALP